MTHCTILGFAYADDLVFMAEDMHTLQRLADICVEALSVCLKNNVRKSAVVKFFGNGIANINLELQQQDVTMFGKYKFLVVTLMNGPNYCDE